MECLIHVSCSLSCRLLWLVKISILKHHNILVLLLLLAGSFNLTCTSDYRSGRIFVRAMTHLSLLFLLLTQKVLRYHLGRALLHLNPALKRLHLLLQLAHLIKPAVRVVIHLNRGHAQLVFLLISLLYLLQLLHDLHLGLSIAHP